MKVFLSYQGAIGLFGNSYKAISIQKNKRMEPNQESYIKADDNRIINEKYIRWVKKMSECLEVCSRLDGCSATNTFKICKLNNPSSYDKLNKWFE